MHSVWASFTYLLILLQFKQFEVWEKYSNPFVASHVKQFIWYSSKSAPEHVKQSL